MTRPDLDALAALYEKATEPTWQIGFAGQSNDPRACNLVSFNGDDIVGVAYVPRADNAALIVAAVNALPSLIARVRELERARDAAANARDVFANGLVGVAIGMMNDDDGAIRAAALAMRERCAQACEMDVTGGTRAEHEAIVRTLRQCAAAIRALEV